MRHLIATATALGLGHSAGKRRKHADLAERLPAFGEGIRSVFHGVGRCGPPVCPERQHLVIGRACDVRAGGTIGMAHPSRRPSADRHVRDGVGTGRGRAEAGDQAWRRDLDAARGEALARSDSGQCHESHRDHEHDRRQERRLDGEGWRRAIPEMKSVPTQGARGDWK